MPRNLLLVDYENKHNLDLSTLDTSYSAIIFVGHLQQEVKIKNKIERTNQFARIDYQKIEGYGKNALDFHIAFTLGRVFESYPDTKCFILSSDKGFDPLITHLNTNNFQCVRVESISELPIESNTVNSSQIKYGVNSGNGELTTCPKCKKNSTIEHNGGRWCTNCGKFATPPDPEIISKLFVRPSAQRESRSNLFCTKCHQNIDVGDGIYDDGEWTCWGCV